jgi:hypothetical protein
MKGSGADVATKLNQLLPPRLVREVTRGDHLRPLEDDEIRRLEENGNVCTDWSLVSVRESFSPARFYGNLFLGRCVVGGHGDTSGASAPSPYPPGVYQSTLSNVRLGENVSIHRCPMISGYSVGNGSTIAGSTLKCTASTSFGNGTRLSPGVETGGRPFAIAAEIDLGITRHILAHPDDLPLQAEFDRFVEHYTRQCQSAFGYVGESCLIENALLVDSAWIGDAARIEAGQCIRNATVLSDLTDPTYVGPGVMIEDSAIQEGSRIESGAVIRSSLIMEHVTCGVGAKITGSVLAPNCAIESGEVTASFVGPFVSLHHESLLIAAYWPQGRGNIGYGANVGSNHTSRVPDQEILPGEGMFFGLGCCVKFPSNFSRAPYTVIATGVTTLPQRVEFPFSLIRPPTDLFDGVSTAIQQLVPAWVLSNNLYALLRNRKKYETRNKARRHTFDFEIFKPSTVETMAVALERLESVKKKRRFYLESDIPGLGKNLLLEADRKAGIEAYRFFLDYAELGRRQRELNATGVAAYSEDGLRELSTAMSRLRSMARQIHEQTLVSRQKDFVRGDRIMENYSATHVPIDADEFILTSEAEMHSLEREIDLLLDAVRRQIDGI